MANFLFQYRDHKLTAKELKKLLKKKFSPKDNNRRTSQEIVMTKLLDFVNCVEHKCHYVQKLRKMQRHMLGNTWQYTLRKRMAEIKQNENRTTSGLPGTSAVIQFSS